MDLIWYFFEFIWWGWGVDEGLSHARLSDIILIKQRWQQRLQPDSVVCRSDFMKSLWDLHKPYMHVCWFLLRDGVLNRWSSIVCPSVCPLFTSCSNPVLFLYSRLLGQLREMETAFDGFWEKHQLKMEQYLQLWKFEQSFQEVWSDALLLLAEVVGEEKEGKRERFIFFWLFILSV